MESTLPEFRQSSREKSIAENSQLTHMQLVCEVSVMDPHSY